MGRSRETYLFLFFFFPLPNSGSTKLGNKNRISHDFFPVLCCSGGGGE